MAKLILAGAWLILICFCATASAASVTVFAAASLMGSLREIASKYEALKSDKIIFNFAASGDLARQIEAGARADLFFSADEDQLNELEKRGMVMEKSRRNRLSNLLVVITTPDNPLSLTSPQDLAGPKVRRVALGQPKIAPVGAYARQYLEKQHLWSSLQAKLVFTANARAALAAVESGNADAGIVYATDTTGSKSVKVIYTVPAEEGPIITYPMVLVKESPQPEAARRFMNFLVSTQAGQVFKKHGFIVLEAASIP